MKLSPLHFQLSIIIKEKRLPNLPSGQLPELTTRQIDNYQTQQLPDSASRRLPDLTSWWLGESTTPRLDEAMTPRLGESANMTILGYSCSLQSLLYTKNYRFTFKALIFAQKRWLNLSKVYW